MCPVAESSGQNTTTEDAALGSARRWATFAYDRWCGRETCIPPAGAPPATELRLLGMSGFVFRALRRADDPRAEAFKADYRHASTANLIRLSHAEAFCGRLERQGIAPVALKGAAFLARFPDDLGVRSMADVDLLVSPADFSTAVASLVSDGYRLHADVGERVRRTLPALDFINDAGPSTVEIDLHRGIAQAPMLPDLTSAILANHVLCGAWRVPGAPEAFCITAIHRARHGFAWRGLDLVDLKQLADAADDAAWQDIVDATVRHRVTGAAYASFRQALWWLGESAQDSTRLALLRRALSRPVSAMLDRLARPNSVLQVNPVSARPLVRTLVVYPCTTGSLWRPLAAAAVHLPRRAMDDWDRTRGDTLPARVAHLARLAVRGSLDTAQPPDTSAFPAPRMEQVPPA